MCGLFASLLGPGLAMSAVPGRADPVQVRDAPRLTVASRYSVQDRVPFAHGPNEPGHRVLVEEAPPSVRPARLRTVKSAFTGNPPDGERVVCARWRAPATVSFESQDAPRISRIDLHQNVVW